MIILMSIYYKYLIYMVILMSIYYKYIKYKNKYIQYTNIQLGGTQPFDIIIYKRSNDVPTHFPARMAYCETALHTIAAKMSTIGSIFTEQNRNLDGIIEIRNSLILTHEPKFSTIVHINQNQYIADHDGIILNLSYINTALLNTRENFNIISCNLEGLCRNNTHNNLYNDRLDLVSNYFSSIKIGTIMACQEIVLSRMKTFIDASGNDILVELKKHNQNLEFISDISTRSGIYYDKVVWKIVSTLDWIENCTLEHNFSTGYLFECNANKNCRFWVINIHLKAFSPISITSITDRFTHCSASKIDMFHIKQLENIIHRIMINPHSPSFNIPIYLCGDYNNPRKHILLKTAIEHVLKNYKVNIK